MMTNFEEDTSLTVLVEFLRDYDADDLIMADVSIASTDGSSTEEITSAFNTNNGDVSSKAKANQRRIRYQKKLKNEREVLKQQELELLAHLNNLRQTEAEQDKDKHFAWQVWRSTAILQREWRMLAEREQEQLKKEVDTRAKLIHEMAEFLTPCLLDSEAQDTDLVNYCSKGDRMQASLFKTFKGELESLYVQTDDVINSMEFKLSPALTYTLARDWNKDMTFMESTSATIIPFSLATTCRALSLLILPPGTEIAGDNNTSARSYQLDFTQELGESATLMIHITVRRYIKTDRVVFVWRLLAEGQGEFEGMYTDESAWFVLWPMKTHNNYGPAVVLQNYTRLLPIGFDGKSDSDTRANRFIEILVKADEMDVKGMKQMMDRLVREKRSC